MNKGFFISIFLFNLLLLIFRVKNLLLILFALEFLILNIFLMLSIYRCPTEISHLLIFLVVAAGEARIGLSLLVFIVRNRGKDRGKNSSLFNLCEGY